MSTAFPHPSSLNTLTHTHTLSLPVSCATSCSSPGSPGRLMQWLIVWEVPLSSLARLEALVRSRIRSFLWTPLCLCQSWRNLRRGQQCTHRIKGVRQWRSKTAKRGHSAAHVCLKHSVTRFKGISLVKYSVTCSTGNKSAAYLVLSH